MLLENKNAVIYGAGGSVGGAVARAFAREGACVFLTGRNLEAIKTLEKEISAAGGTAETAQVDALDEEAVASHLDIVVDKAGKIDISFNAIGIPQQGMQGIPFTELSVESFALPITTYARSHFVTGRAAARHMIGQRSGVVLMHTPEPGPSGFTAAWRHEPSLGRNGLPQAPEFGGIGAVRRARCLASQGGRRGATDDRRGVEAARQGTWHHARGI